MASNKRSSVVEILILAALLGLSAYLRTVYVVGHGLGDDSIYSATAYNILQVGASALPTTYGPNYRVGVLLPVAISFKLFGVNDMSFVIFPILSSVLLVAVVYALAREVAGREAAFFSALVQAVSTFDVTFASSMTIDLIQSLFFALAVYFFIYSEKKAGKANFAYSLLSVISVFWAIYVKISGFVIMPVFLALTALRLKNLRKHVNFYILFAMFLSASFLIDYCLTGDFLNHFHRMQEAVPAPSIFADAWADYPKFMFLKSELYDNLFFGLHFWLAAAAVSCCLLRREMRAKSSVFLAWFFVLFLVSEFLPQKFELPYVVPYRFFRHAYAFVVPAALISGVFLSHIWAKVKNNAVFSVFTVFLLLLYMNDSIERGLWLGKLYKEHFDDARAASDFILSMPQKTIISDGKLRGEYIFRSGYTRYDQFPWQYNGTEMQQGIVGGGGIDLLYGLNDSYAVLGGSRGVDYGTNWILNQGNKTIPPGWQLIGEISAPIDKYRPETLKIYYAK